MAQYTHKLGTDTVTPDDKHTVIMTAVDAAGPVPESAPPTTGAAPIPGVTTAGGTSAGWNNGEPVAPSDPYADVTGITKP